MSDHPRLRITFAHPFLLTPRGAEIHVTWMLRDLAARGHRCSLVTGAFNRGVAEFADLERRGVTIYETGHVAHRNPWRERLSTQAGLSDWLVRNRSQMDILCVVNWPAYWTALDFPANDRPAVIHLLLEPMLGWVSAPYRKLHWPALWLIRAWYHRRNRRAMQACDLTLCHTETMRRHLLKTYGRDATPTGLGIDTRLFQPDDSGVPALTIDPNALNILTTAKGLRELLPAFTRARAARPELALYVMGGDASLTNPQAGIHALPFMARETLPALYSSMDVFWLHSPHEPWGLQVLEALACGAAVLAHASGGPAQILAGGDIGILYGDMREAEALLRDPARFNKPLLQGKGFRGAALAQREHRWDQTAEKYHDLFLRCWRQKKKSATDEHG